MDQQHDALKDAVVRAAFAVVENWSWRRGRPRRDRGFRIVMADLCRACEALPKVEQDVARATSQSRPARRMSLEELLEAEKALGQPAEPASEEQAGDEAGSGGEGR